CRIEAEKARFISRNGRDWTAKFPELAELAGELPLSNAILDGEIVAMQPDGTTSFQALQNVFQEGETGSLLYFVFDLLYLNGRDIRALALEDRKALLFQVVPGAANEPIKYSEHVVGNGGKFFTEAARLHLEGVVSKRLGSRYSAGRGLD